MPGAPINKVLPQTINPRKFAFQDTQLSGEILAGKLARLNQALSEDHELIAVDLHFHVADNGKAVVAGTVTTTVALECQRCLEPVKTPINIEVYLAPVLTDDQSKALEKHLDPWLIVSEDGSADLYQQLEDELLLALPMVAFHPEQCIDPATLSSRDPNSSEKEQEKDNPFAVLAQLKSDTTNE